MERAKDYISRSARMWSMTAADNERHPRELVQARLLALIRSEYTYLSGIATDRAHRFLLGLQSDTTRLCIADLLRESVCSRHGKRSPSILYACKTRVDLPKSFPRLYPTSRTHRTLCWRLRKKLAGWLISQRLQRKCPLGDRCLSICLHQPHRSTNQ